MLLYNIKSSLFHLLTVLKFKLNTMVQNCLCALGDPNHCTSCSELQAEYDKYCLEMHESYLWYKEQEAE